jgi:hypothetical protein
MQSIIKGFSARLQTLDEYRLICRSDRPQRRKLEELVSEPAMHGHRTDGGR